MALLRAGEIKAAMVVLAALPFFLWTALANDEWLAVHWLHCACYLEDGTRRIALVSRVATALFGAFLLVWVRPRARRVHPITIVGALVAIALSLVVCEGFLRWQRARREAAASLPAGHSDVMAHDGRQSLDHISGGRSIHYVTDEHGYRVRDESTTVDLSKPSVVIAGESVAFGFGLEYDETIGARVALQLGLQDVNIGWSGFSVAYTLHHLQKELPKLERPVAVVCFVVHSWLVREADPRLWHVEWEGGNNPALPPRPPSATDSPLLQLLRTLFPYHDDHRFDIARFAMKEIAALSRAHGATPLFVLTECGARCRSTEFIERELTRGLDADWIAMSTPLEENLVGDIHPGPTAAARYADRIVARLRR